MNRNLLRRLRAPAEQSTLIGQRRPQIVNEIGRNAVSAAWFKHPPKRVRAKHPTTLSVFAQGWLQSESASAPLINQYLRDNPDHVGLVLQQPRLPLPSNIFEAFNFFQAVSPQNLQRMRAHNLLATIQKATALTKVDTVEILSESMGIIDAIGATEENNETLPITAIKAHAPAGLVPLNRLAGTMIHAPGSICFDDSYDRRNPAYKYGVQIVSEAVIALTPVNQRIQALRRSTSTHIYGLDNSNDGLFLFTPRDPSTVALFDAYQVYSNADNEVCHVASGHQRYAADFSRILTQFDAGIVPATRDETGVLV